MLSETEGQRQFGGLPQDKGAKFRMKDATSGVSVTCEGGCHRGGKPKVYEIVSFNTSGRPQLQGALRALAKQRPEGHNIAAVCVQEHQLIGDRLVDQVLHAKARG